MSMFAMSVQTREGAPDRQNPIELNMNYRLPVLGMSCKLTRSCLVAAFAAGLSLASPASSQPSHRNSPVRSDVGRIVGNIDGISRDGARTYISITDVENSAKMSSSSGAFSLDAIFFGRWRD
jgi:hypothetical protein